MYNKNLDIYIYPSNCRLGSDAAPCCHYGATTAQAPPPRENWFTEEKMWGNVFTWNMGGMQSWTCFSTVLQYLLSFKYIYRECEKRPGKVYYETFNISQLLEYVDRESRWPGADVGFDSGVSPGSRPRQPTPNWEMTAIAQCCITRTDITPFLGCPTTLPRPAKLSTS